MTILVIEFKDETGECGPFATEGFAPNLRAEAEQRMKFLQTQNPGVEFRIESYDRRES